MAKFLNTSVTNYFLEELIKGARDRLILISPYLKLNDRIKELLEDNDFWSIFRNKEMVLKNSISLWILMVIWAVKVLFYFLIK